MRKAKITKSKTIAGFCLSLAFLAVTSGCTTKMLTAAVSIDPQAETARLLRPKEQSWGADVLEVGIDGVMLPHCPFSCSDIELKPGQHTIQLEGVSKFQVVGPGCQPGTVANRISLGCFATALPKGEITLNAVAGHTYVFGIILASGTLNYRLFDLTTQALLSKGYFPGP
jgi:hypothetical protein